MEGVSTGSVGNELSQNVSSSLLGMGKVFQDKNASSFTNDEAIAFSVKGTGG